MVHFILSNATKGFGEKHRDNETDIKILSALTPLTQFCHCCMLGESICHFRGVGSILSLLFYF